MGSRRSGFVAGLILSLAVACPSAPIQSAGATTISLAPIKDNTLYESTAGSLSNGAGDYLFAGRTNHPPNSLENPTDRRGLYRRALLEFDVAAALPDGARVVSAELRLYVSNVSLLNDTNDLDVPVSVHRVLAAWGEAGSDAVQQEGIGALAQEGDATWLHRVFGADVWNAAGGDFSEAASAVTIVGDKFRQYVWSGDGPAADVQGWLDDPESNHGWLVVGDESLPLTAKRFNSRENPDPATRPSLVVTYEIIPEPSVIVCLLLGGAGIGIRGGRFRNFDRSGR